MNIKEIKLKMLNWLDFYEQDIPDTESIKKSKNRQDLREVLQKHIEFLEMQNIEAINYVESFMIDLEIY